MEMRQLLRDCGQPGSPRAQGQQGTRVTVRRESLKPAPTGFRWMAQPAWKRERAAYFDMRTQPQPDSHDWAISIGKTKEPSDFPSEASSTNDKVTLSQRPGVNVVSRVTQPGHRPYIRPLLERQVVVSRPQGRTLHWRQVHQVKRYLEDGGATIIDVPRKRDRRSVTITVASAGMVARICENRIRRVRGKKMSFQQLRDRLGAHELPLQEIERIALKLQTTPEGRNQLADMINEGLIPLTSEHSTSTASTGEDSGVPEAGPTARGDVIRSPDVGYEMTSERGPGPTDLADGGPGYPPIRVDSDPIRGLGSSESLESGAEPAPLLPEPGGAFESPIPSPKDPVQPKSGPTPSATKNQTDWNSWKQSAWTQEAARLKGLKKANQAVEQGLSNTGPSKTREQERRQEARARDKAALERYRLYFDQHERLKRLRKLREEAKEAETFRDYQPATHQWKPTSSHQQRRYFPWIRGKWSAWCKRRTRGRQRRHEVGNISGVAGRWTTLGTNPADKTHVNGTETWDTRQTQDFGCRRRNPYNKGGSDRWR